MKEKIKELKTLKGEILKELEKVKELHTTLIIYNQHPYTEGYKYFTNLYNETVSKIKTLETELFKLIDELEDS